MVKLGHKMRRALRAPLTATVARSEWASQLLAGLGATPSASGRPRRKRQEDFWSSMRATSRRRKPTGLPICPSAARTPIARHGAAGLEAAAQKYGFTYKRFAANFNPAAQIKQVQNAITEGFDGYLFAPTAAAPACSMWKRHLQPLDEPTVSLDLPMCEDADYSEGLAGDGHHAAAGLLQTRTSITRSHPARSPARVAAVGGFVGSDLFGFWEKAIQQGARRSSRMPRSSWTSRRTSTRAWRSRRSRTALLAHPDITVILSSWDDMSRGVEQAVEAAGKTPGTDIRIYSIGATRTASPR